MSKRYCSSLLVALMRRMDHTDRFPSWSNPLRYSSKKITKVLKHMYCQYVI